MRKSKILIAAALTLFTTCRVSAQTDLDDLINKFSSSDWKVVKAAKTDLENLEEQAIDELISLLDKDVFVKLTNSGTLIYPGAEKIYGHGQIIDYSIDNLSIRSGWLLEEITFNNFGFSGIHLPDENLIPFIKITFPDYYNNATNRKKLETSSGPELSRLIHKLSVKAAKDWWADEKDDWTRIEGLQDALKSFDEKRQVKALFYIRNGTTKCTNLTKEFYYNNISKEIVRLSGSETLRVAEHARWILFDSKLTWLDNKGAD